jgi:hypothetical protein
MRRSIVLLIFLMAALMAAPGQAAPRQPGTQMSERDQWAADLDYLAKELPARHKNLYFKISAALKARIPKLSRPEFLADLARLVASVGDSHTSFTVIPQKAFPLKLYWFKEGICVTDTASEYAELLDGRLESVDGHPVEDVVRAFSGIIPHDNDAQVEDFVPRFLASSEHLLGLGLIAEPDEATFMVRAPSGRRVSAKMTSVPLGAIKRVTWAAPAVDPARLPLYRRTAGSAYEYAYLADSRTLYFAYNSCRDLPGRPFAAFAAELWNTVKKDPVEKMVIDLRNNGGGDSSILDAFIGQLAAAKEINRKGRLFVIIGRRTFSSAILNAVDLKKRTEAVFYGEPRRLSRPPRPRPRRHSGQRHRRTILEGRGLRQRLTAAGESGAKLTTRSPLGYIRLISPGGSDEKSHRHRRLGHRLRARGRHRLPLHDAVHTRLVCRSLETAVQSPQLDFRPGLDDPLCLDGPGRLPRL